ncbi:23S rRNA (adenine(2030)-N(6))-methyltransferase RlmJ [Treponema bryantii]|uniref:23S rRNA (adenine(2030)-N(6))-methyltransferase RlmJ n=1 Tax=Treponema bryantii TaxID=163 RepID=UPI0003B785AE|nr:23S rRNA (adenine(2030)-N(6))-methyltransferase RlmJ [Treponema bryantii]
MLSYQHIFHAGNHADLLKHSVLIQVLEALNKKEKPYTFFDTHAASGLYDLKDNRSLKTGEATKGIVQFADKADMPQAFADYVTFVQKYLKDSLYPGSPEIERSFMRKQDTLILSELHPQEIENLRHNMKKSEDGQPEIQIHNRNSWEMLKALTPPATKRGAALIDPSYEEASDYTIAADTICAVHKKWSNGIIMLWYPLLAHRQSEIGGMINQITNEARSQNANIEIADLRLQVFDKNEHKEVSLEEFRASEGKNPPRLYGSGMLVLNAPWMLKENTQETIDYIKNAF